MSDNLEAALIAAHRKNINRYRHLLDTPLTELERLFVARRLAEEKLAVAELLAGKRDDAAADHRCLRMLVL